MGRIVSSARGERVDFDLLKIKQQIVNQSPVTEPVVERQEDVERKMRRHLRRKKTGEVPVVDGVDPVQADDESDSV